MSDALSYLQLAFDHIDEYKKTGSTYHLSDAANYLEKAKQIDPDVSYTARDSEGDDIRIDIPRLSGLALYFEAKEDFDNGLYNSAASLCERSLQHLPNFRLAKNLLADAKLNGGDAHTALHIVQTQAREAPTPENIRTEERITRAVQQNLHNPNIFRKHPWLLQAAGLFVGFWGLGYPWTSWSNFYINIFFFGVGGLLFLAGYLIKEVNFLEHYERDRRK
ncbi:MAG: hypothetical protein KGZ73_05115 [Rhizobiales bacterium]|nr:hypothetical protein [Hyphomicrobiales bacterium]